VSYDLSTPIAPVVSDFWNIPGAPAGTASNGPYAFAAAGSLGFHLVFAGMPYTPSLAWDGAEAPGRHRHRDPGELGVHDRRRGQPRHQAYDVTSPASPVLGGFTSLAGPNGIVIAGDYAFVANGSTLKVLDIRNPAAALPEVGTASSRFGSMSSVAVSGDLAFLVGGAFQCFDISDPANPVYRASTIQTEEAFTAWRAGEERPTSPKATTSSRTA